MNSYPAIIGEGGSTIFVFFRVSVALIVLPPCVSKVTLNTGISLVQDINKVRNNPIAKIRTIAETIVLFLIKNLLSNYASTNLCSIFP